MSTEFETYFTRHSNSPYKNYAETLASENPQASFDHTTQEAGDLSEKGINLAREKAAEFIASLDPQKDVLFFVSSNEARAIETAAIYREEALAKGFAIMKPDHTRSKLAEEAGGGDIRVLKSLSLDFPNALAATAFNPSATLPETINLEVLDEETKQKWEAARAIILQDDKGSWGANFHAHSKAIQGLFPEMKTSEDLHEGQLENLLRILKWADQKVRDFATEEHVKVLAFGHENYLMQVLEEKFGAEGIKNCETITLNVDENQEIEAEFRGENAFLEA